MRRSLFPSFTKRSSSNNCNDSSRSLKSGSPKTSPTNGKSYSEGGDKFYELTTAVRQHTKKESTKRRKEEKGETWGLRADFIPAKWMWDAEHCTFNTGWAFTPKSFTKTTQDGEVRYLYGDTTLVGPGVYVWGLKVGNPSFLYVGHVDAEKFRGWNDVWPHTSLHSHCVSYAGGIYYQGGKQLGVAKRIRAGSVIWMTVDFNDHTVTMTRGKDMTKQLCKFYNVASSLIPWVGVGCANIPYELRFPTVQHPRPPPKSGDNDKLPPTCRPDIRRRLLQSKDSTLTRSTLSSYNISSEGDTSPTAEDTPRQLNELEQDKRCYLQNLRQSNVTPRKDSLPPETMTVEFPPPPLSNVCSSVDSATWVGRNFFVSSSRSLLSNSRLPPDSP